MVSPALLLGQSILNEMVECIGCKQSHSAVAMVTHLWVELEDEQHNHSVCLTIVRWVVILSQTSPARSSDRLLIPVSSSEATGNRLISCSSVHNLICVSLTLSCMCLTDPLSYVSH